jgi:hypothetical protein
MLNIISVLAAGVTTVLFFIFGVLSIYKPEIIGVEGYWVKHKWFYILKYKKSDNKYYHKQIRTVGLGFLVGAFFMLIFTVVYIVYPDVLLLFK